MADVDWKALYVEKEKHLDTFLEKVTPEEFYRDLWPVGTFEREGHPEDEKPNGLALQIEGKGKARHIVLTDGLEQLEDALQGDFVITSPVSYYGRRRTGKNARWAYAMTFDLDGVQMPQLRDVLHQADYGYIPKPTYVVNSGRGLHLYYVFKNPAPMMPNIQAGLKELKYSLTRVIWNRFTSTRKDIEVQGILQGFRMVGSPSKLGREYPVTAYRFGDRVTYNELHAFVPKATGEFKKVLDAFDNKTTLEEAKQKYPEWYQRRVVEGKPRGKWTVKRDLYDWWLNRIRNEITVGHRFFGCMTLAIYAVKCGISEEELREDAYSLLEQYDAMSIEDDNRFEDQDIEDAIGIYNDSYSTFPRDDIGKVTGLNMPVNKRNGRKQEQHIRVMNAVRDVLHPDGSWRNKEGRPKGSGTAAAKVREYRGEHPEATVTEVARALGISRPTVYKWWD